MVNIYTKRLRLLGMARAWIGVTLLALTAVALLASPITQRLWTWDRYLHGGHDFETGVLAILISLSLILLLTQHCKQAINALAAAPPGSSSVANDLSAALRELSRIAADCCQVRCPRSLHSNYSLPLTI
jgi:hypothetical protein